MKQMRTIVGMLLVAISTATALPTPSSASATLLTVQLFSTRVVKKITVTPLDKTAWISTCSKCSKQPVANPIEMEGISDNVKLASGAAFPQIKLSGAFRVKTGGQEQEALTAGLWTITASQHGLKILLALPSERYVVAALNGEASPDEPLQSLKAMAVSMRTFALANSGRHLAEGFDLCDSTHCQALRFGKARPEIEQAVRETVGETLWSARQRAHIYYTQHCGGTTEAAANLWPAEHASYLVSHPDQYCLRRSSAAWSTQINLDQLNAIFHQQAWHTPATLNAIHIVDRTSSGRAAKLEVDGPGGRATISASSFRFAVNRALGWNQIRSDWYSIKIVNDVLHIEGRGYGHGVGLCQAGAFEMATEGHDYRQILSYYFPGTTVRVTPNDTGWKSSEKSGVTLFSVTSSISLQDQATKAWVHATALFPSETPIHPVIYALPTTELFRQTTGEPGWVLASTRKDHVYLQPTQIIERNTRTQKVLLHEFLHVLVEHQATPRTPLWLREGLVEALAGERAASPHMSTTEIDSILERPFDLTASQQAHAAAGHVVSKLQDEYGLPAIQNWLHNGVPANIANNLADTRVQTPTSSR